LLITVLIDYYWKSLIGASTIRLSSDVNRKMVEVIIADQIPTENPSKPI
jgi:hypothetical protein